MMVPDHIQKLLEQRYYLRDEEGNLLEKIPEDMFARVAHSISRAEVAYDTRPESLGSDRWCEKFYQLMNEKKFMPSSPTLINAGKEKAGCYSACFCLDVPDSMEGIFESVKKAAIISKSGGGVGFNFSNLREKGAIVRSTGHKASGPVSFMRVFNTMCDTIAQGGVRRGAMIGLLDISHPDIEEFISCKDDGVSFTNFNISVSITDEFMQAVDEDGPWQLMFEDEVVPKKIVSAKELWQKICEHAWKTGEPGIVFIDEMNRGVPDELKIIGVNPCGEIGLEDGGSCNLGSMNLLAYLNKVTNDFDYKDFAQDVKTAVRFMDDVIAVNPYPSPEISQVAYKTRKIGLGVMGWADLLISMKIPYDSEEALELADAILSVMSNAADDASYSLGLERGDFPSSGVADLHRRNYTLLCVAPTGTISRIVGVSSGIEPVFAWETHHNIGVPYTEEHWAYTNWCENNPDYLDIPDYLKTASEISPYWHLQHQARFQGYMDNSVSKTINLPDSATVEDVERIFMQAHEYKCKGTTVYRDGSRDNQPLTDTRLSPVFIKTEGVEIQNNGDAKFSGGTYPRVDKQVLNKVLDYSKHVTLSPPAKLENVFLKEDPYKNWEPSTKSLFRKRGHIAVGPTHKIDTGKGKIYITVNYDRAQQEPVEVFIRLGPSATPRETELGDWIGRMLSLCLKHNVPIKDIVRQSEKVYGESSFVYMNRFFNSLPQLIAYLISFSWEETLEMVELEDGAYDPEEGWEEKVVQQATEVDSNSIPNYEYCYECEGYYKIREGGCMVCQNCGDSKCG